MASNRLPLRLTGGAEDGWSCSPATGGLVTALEPVLRRRGGTWVGWPGCPDAGQEALAQAAPALVGGAPYGLRAVSLNREEEHCFYQGFSNQVLWPLLHGFSALCDPDPEYWRSYREVNRRFAERLAEVAGGGGTVWVHDYHLMLVARELRELGVDGPLSFFLHTPFPPGELLESVSCGHALVEGLLHYDLVGFQTEQDQAHFVDAVRRIHPEALSEAGGGVELTFGDRRVRTGAFPISIDFKEFFGAAHNPVVMGMAWDLRRRLGDRSLLLGVDRLDYSKGIPQKLRGFRRVLRRHPELRGRMVLKQLVIPSRDGIPAYRATKVEIEGLVRAINQEFADLDSPPVEYQYGSWDRMELLAHYREADVALVTPLNDGMNLVAKEYVASNGGGGVLILSQGAGAAWELGREALIVDPGDPDAVARSIVEAHSMPLRERRRRMTSAQAVVRSRDVHRWVEGFLSRTPRMA